MKAAFRDRYGAPADVVGLRETDRPTPKDGEVLVRVHAASVNRADFDGIEPRPAFVRLFLGLRAPRNPRLGLDVAGVVESVGTDVTRFMPGDRVFADLYPFGQGAFAEYVCAPERAFQPIPDGLSFEVASTLPHSAILAVQGLRLRDGRTPEPGDRVLDRRCLGQRRSVRGPDREVDGRGGHRRLQRGEDGLRPLARRRPRARLHDRRLHDHRRALRLDRRHRLAPFDPADPARAAPERDLRHARRRRTPDRRGGGARPGHLAGDRQAHGPDALVETVQDRGRRYAYEDDRGRLGDPGHRPAVPARRRHRRAALHR